MRRQKREKNGQYKNKKINSHSNSNNDDDDDDNEQKKTSKFIECDCMTKVQFPLAHTSEP